MARLTVWTQHEIRCDCGFGISWDGTDESLSLKERHEKQCAAVSRWYRTHSPGHFRWEKHFHIRVYGACREEITPSFLLNELVLGSD